MGAWIKDNMLATVMEFDADATDKIFKD